jgi:hypothetical protein
MPISPDAGRQGGTYWRRTCSGRTPASPCSQNPSHTLQAARLAFDISKDRTKITARSFILLHSDQIVGVRRRQSWPNPILSPVLVSVAVSVAPAHVEEGDH